MAKKNVIMNKLNDGTPEVYVYGYIDGDMAGEFAKQIKALEKDNTLINVRINSDGGSVYAGVAMFNCIRTSKCAIDVYIDGIAASMASAIAMAGRKVYMSRFARIMTHAPSGYGGGSAEELRAIADEIDAITPILNELYAQKTGLTKDEVTSKFLNGKDNFFGADAAMKAKLIDGIYDGLAIDNPESTDIKAVYEAFQTKLTASLTHQIQNNNTDMRQFTVAIWSQICAVLGITDSVEDAAVVAALKKITVEAAKVPTLEAKVTKAETALADLKKETVTKEITAMLDNALDVKKISAKEKAIYAKHYEDDADGLKEILESRDAYVSVTALIKESDKTGADELDLSPKAKALFDKGWDKLDREGGLAELKEENEEAYLALYEAKFGFLPNEKPFQEPVAKAKKNRK